MTRHTSRIARMLALSAGIICVAASTAVAEEFPGQGEIRVQTNGPAAPIAFGDWYSSPLRAGGEGDHFVQIQVPRGWPGSKPLDIDIFSAELNRSGTPIAIALDEIDAAPRSLPAGDTEFELFGPDIIATGPRRPRPGARGSIRMQKFAPSTDDEQWTRLATIRRPRPGSTYLVRSDASGGDQNSWKIRVGDDNDADPNNSLPSTYDNPDGTTGTGDEPAIRPLFVSYQHFGADGACHTFSRFVDAGATLTRFSNFDMDIGNVDVVPPERETQVRLRYYAPSDTYDASGYGPGSTPTNHPAPFLSGDDVWNGGARNAKVGDVFASPEAGWWRIVFCTNAGNQYIVEADGAEARPTAPVIRASMTDGQATAARGSLATYRVTIANEASGASAGAATNLSVTDTLPSGLDFVSCRVLDPFRGTCALTGPGTVQAVIRGLLKAGRTAQVEIKTRISATAADGVVIENPAVVNFTDTFDNRYPEVRVSDSTIVDSGGPGPALDPDPVPDGPAF